MALRDRSPRTFSVDGATLPVRVRESTRARRARVVVAPGRRIEVVVPLRSSSGEVDRLLDIHRDWIERRLAAEGSAPRLGLAGRLWVKGRPVPAARVAGPPRARLRAGVVEVGGTDPDAVPALDRWYRRTARELIGSVASREAARLGLRFRSISIRDQRTRWGSCSARGTLSFSWRLLLVPPEILEYVVVHELCHLRELNHSQRFWRVLDEARPGWRGEAAWLREHAAEIHAYDVASALGL